ncbi:hypothetical protein AB664_27215 [Brucella anthropi]|uniref:Uncharacterized protein n=1 Tax=Brucella anthropi TaxID=529 RepID=A0A656Z5V5_BRUAN|nr:hypothetical protein AB664_27215 [Brucella anthropi]
MIARKEVYGFPGFLKEIAAQGVVLIVTDAVQGHIAGVNNEVVIGLRQRFGEQAIVVAEIGCSRREMRI